MPCAENEIRYSTIQKDLDSLAGDLDLDNAVFLFHGPPFETNLDRVANDGKMVDYVPLDLHVGSIAGSGALARASAARWATSLSPEPSSGMSASRATGRSIRGSAWRRSRNVTR